MASRWNPRFTRRAYLRSSVGAFGAAAVAGLLTACSAPAAPTPPPPAKTTGQPAPAATAVPVAPAAQAKPSGEERTLVYWTFMATDQRFPDRKVLFPQWGEQNKAKVQIEEVAAGNPFTQKMSAAFAAKLLPDLLDPWDSNAVITFAAQGFLKDVEDVMKESGRDDFFPTAVDFGTLKGKLFGMPLLGYPHLMHYRKDWFAEEGLKPPTTWEELYPVVKKLHGKKKDGGEIAGISGYFGSIHAPPFFQNMVGPNNGFTFDEAGKVVIDSKEVQQAMQHVKNLVPFFQSGYANMNYGDTRNQFVDGKIAIEMDSTSMANVIVKSKPEMGEKVTSVVLPWGPSSKQNRSGYNGISYFSIGSQTKFPDLAQSFLTWFYSPEIYLKAFLSYDWGLIPERRSTATSPEWHNKLPPQAKPIVEAGAKAAEISTFPGQDHGPHPIGNKLLAEDIYRNLLQKIASGTDTVDGALKWAKGEIDRINKEG